MVNLYGSLQDMLENEIEEIVKKGKLDQTSLCNLDKLVDIVEDVEKIKEKKSAEYSGYGGMIYNDGYSGRNNSYAQNGSGNYNYNYARGNSYDGGNYERGRSGNNYGMYEGRGNGYSGHADKNHMISLMQEAMNHASSQEERDEIMKMIQKMEK